MQRVKVQLYTGTCTPLTHQPIYLQLAADWAVPHPWDPSSLRDTRVSLTNYTPPTSNASLPSVHPSLLIRGRDTVVSSQSPMPSYILPSCPPLLPPCLPPRCLSVTPDVPSHPSSLPQACALSPGYHVEENARALSPCLDPDTNRKGRKLNDGFSKCAYWLEPTWLWGRAHTQPRILPPPLSAFLFPFSFPPSHSLLVTGWQWCRLFTISLTCPPLYLSCWAHN